jgi:predicted RNA-binding Zn ribbon-like protein
MTGDALSVPLLGQRLAVEFANTAYAVRGQPREGIGTAPYLLAWLHGHASQLATQVPDEVSDVDIRQFRDLRDAIRALSAAIVDGRDVPDESLGDINRVAAAAPCWPDLGTDLVAAVRTAAPAAVAVRAEIARDAIDLFAGPDRTELRRCGAPGCVLYFVKDHPRRQWCSPSCGTRARVARHYRRHRQD